MANKPSLLYDRVRETSTTTGTGTLTLAGAAANDIVAKLGSVSRVPAA